LKKKNHRETNLDTIFTLDFDQVLQIFSSPVSVWIGDAKGNDVADKQGSLAAAAVDGRHLS